MPAANLSEALIAWIFARSSGKRGLTMGRLSVILFHVTGADLGEAGAEGGVAHKAAFARGFVDHIGQKGRSADHEDPSEHQGKDMPPIDRRFFARRKFRRGHEAILPPFAFLSSSSQAKGGKPKPSPLFFSMLFESPQAAFNVGGFKRSLASSFASFARRRSFT